MKKILINHNPWQVRVAVMREDELQDVYFDTLTDSELERCFFKGRVAKVLPGIQTAFVDIGQEKAGFLHITEIDRALALSKSADYADATPEEQEVLERRIKKEMEISKIFREGEEILVQVSKEPISTKGAKLSTCFTLPGRMIVLMPNVPQIGISIKIERRDECTRLRDILTRNLPKGMGAVIRTTAEDKDEKEIKKDLAFLIQTWKSVQKKFKKAEVGEKVHQDLPLTLRVVRDHLDKDVEIVLTDSEEDQRKITSFVKGNTPEQAHKIRLYQGPPALFERYGVDSQIEVALSRKALLKSGGSLIIESTEAMTVVDVNTGRFTGKNNLEETIFKTNMEAAEEVVRQLRLRNIGGLIVIDFIDMQNASNRQKLSRLLEKTLKERDKFQSVALKVSEFGLVQMTRKRSGKTLVQQLTKSCGTCKSYGFVKSPRSEGYDVLRLFQEAGARNRYPQQVTLKVTPAVFDHLLHKEYTAILELEKQLKIKIALESDAHLEIGKYKVEKF